MKKGKKGGAVKGSVEAKKPTGPKPAPKPRPAPVTTEGGGEESGGEGDGEGEVEAVTADVDMLVSLTGQPMTEDELLFAVPIVAPYNTLSNYK